MQYIWSCSVPQLLPDPTQVYVYFLSQKGGKERQKEMPKQSKTK